MRARRRPDRNHEWRRRIAESGHAGPVPSETRWSVFSFLNDPSAQKTYWTANRAEILRDWIKARPGSRPQAWWDFDAPGYRQRLTTKGPSNEALRECSTNDAGIPCHYDDPHEIEQDRPIFESQAAFLERHGLMTQTEKSRLKPADFEPERL